MPLTLHPRIHLLNFLRKLTVTSILFLLPLRFLDLGYDGWRIGIIVSMFAVAPLLASFPTGWINDRLSIAGVIRAGLLGQGVVLLSMAWIKAFPLMAAAFLLLGLANNVLDVSFNSMYYKDETAMDQNRKYGIYVFWTSFGPAVGVLAGGLLVKAADFRLLLTVFAAIMVLSLGAARRLDRAKFHRVSLREYGRNVLRKKTLLFILFVFILALHWGVEGTVFSPFLQRAFGLKNFGLALYISFGLFSLSFSAVLIGFLKFNLKANRRLLLAAMFMSGAGFVLMAAVRGVVLSFVFNVVHQVGDGALGALLTLFTSRLFEKRSIGGSAGLAQSVPILGQMAGAMIFSPLGYRWGLQYPFFLCGGLLVLNALYGAVIFRKMEY
jgi:MFS family permease